MSTTPHPIRTTIVFGLICALAFIPLVIGLGYLIPQMPAFRLTLWIYLASYGLLMVRWSKANVFSILFPLLIVLVATFALGSLSSYCLIAIAIFSWIRSGICYATKFKNRIIAEAILCIGAGVLVGSFSPMSPINWAVAIWMFFLVQALYFVFFEDHYHSGQGLQRDAFEQAREQAEKILSAGL